MTSRTIIVTLLMAISMGSAPTIANPACADYTTYANPGPIPQGLNINGFVIRDVDESQHCDDTADQEPRAANASTPGVRRARLRRRYFVLSF